MAEGARVDSVDALQLFKVALWKFQETAAVALGDAESDMHRTLLWLETEQDSHWQGQVRKRQELVARAKEAVRMKKIFKDSSGRQQSAVEEEKALQLALRRLSEAEQKLANTRRWSRVLQKEIELYKGSVQRFATTVQVDIPAAAAHLDSLSSKLDAYLAVQPAGFGQAGGGETAAITAQPSMARGGEGATIRADQAADASLIDELRLVLPTVPDDHRSAFAGIALERRMPPEDAKVLVAREALQAGSLSLAHERDGWSLAPADSAGPLTWDAIRVTDFARWRPDLEEFLTLPEGFSVMIDFGGIAAILDPSRRALWTRATQP